MTSVMRVILFLSDFIIPCLMVLIISYGMLMKKNIYEIFIEGAVDGGKTVVKILPTLIALMIAVGVLRSSGFLDFFADVLSNFHVENIIPTELVPLVIVRLFSSSAATGLALDLFKEYGTDSFLGIAVSLLLSSTETVFYTMSVYFLTAKVTKTRWTLPGALIATFSGVAASILLAASTAVQGRAV